MIRKPPIVGGIHRDDPIRKLDASLRLGKEFDLAQNWHSALSGIDAQTQRAHFMGFFQSDDSITARFVGLRRLFQIAPRAAVVTRLPDVTLRRMTKDKGMIADDLENRSDLPRLLELNLPPPTRFALPADPRS
jgi:hypothetical protein